MLDKFDLYKLILNNFNQTTKKTKTYNTKETSRDLSFAKSLMNNVVKASEYKPYTKNFEVKPEHYDAFAVALMVTLAVNRNNNNINKILFDPNYSKYIKDICEKIVNNIHLTNGFNKKYLDHYLSSLLVEHINIKNRIQKIFEDNKKETIEKIKNGLYFCTYYNNMMEKLLGKKVMYGTILGETAEELYQIILLDTYKHKHIHSSIYNALTEEKETIIKLLNSLILELNQLTNENLSIID